VPLFRKNGELYVLLTQRTENVKTHKGQISFPGGKHEEVDRSVIDTALREAHEEVGIEPEDVTVLGELDDMATTESNYIISPVVGFVPYPYAFHADEWETKEVIEVPVSALLDKHNCETGFAMVDGLTVNTYTYNYDGRVIWGATARILKQLLDILSGSN